MRRTGLTVPEWALAAHARRRRGRYFPLSRPARARQDGDRGRLAQQHGV